ncbi:hypothetical protein SASPL_127350 [Salvia splendens]|uniref:Uncharacterized protein n=1 Tax=Salvia splendens TaxID=180675 RepID=A0A8X8X9H4_SALSN|nr:hypothetical protein SASPL_127350 [Salvia splendens]
MQPDRTSPGVSDCEASKGVQSTPKPKKKDRPKRTRSKPMAGSPSSPITGDVPEGFTLHEVGQMVHDLTLRIASDEKKIQSNRFAHEAFERQQTILNKSVEDLIAPASLSDAIALAQQLAACRTATAQTTPPSSRPVWSNRDQRQSFRATSQTTKVHEQPKPQPNVRAGAYPPEGQPRDYPIVRVSAAERAERTSRGLCWYCPAKYTREHVCSKKFYALIGEDSEDDECGAKEDDSTNDDGENMVISGDVSTIHVIGPKLKPRSLRITGNIKATPVSVLIDGGSTHNFIKPSVAESTTLILQGHSFEVDLFLLQVEGPDVILGVQWLQDLGDVTKNYKTLTMRFELNQVPICLQGEDTPPRRISYNSLFSLIGQDPESEIFEIIPIQNQNQAEKQPVLPVNPILHDILIPAVSALPVEFHRSQPDDTPLRAMDKRTVLVDKVPQEQWLVQWSSDTFSDATWEDAAPDAHSKPASMQPDRTSPGVSDCEASKGVQSTPKPKKKDRPKRTRSKPVKFGDFISH